MPEYSDVIFLQAGTNDVFVGVSWSYPIIKRLLGQHWAKNKKQFEATYRKLVLFLKQRTAKLFLIPPLLMGEDLGNRWNHKFYEIEHLISKIACEFDNVSLVDIRSIFCSHLKEAPVSEYIAKSAWGVLVDALFVNNNQAVDRVSRKRGLILTLDGVHLNGKGAEILANVVSCVINSRRFK
jgi:lysophospholipase L1-like esterase